MSPPGDETSLYRSLFAAYPDGLLLVDLEGRIVLANPAAARLLGYPIEELTGLQVDELVPDAIRSRHAAYRDAYGRAPRPRPMGLQMDLVAKRRDGSEVMVEIARSPLQDQGLPYVVAAIRDVGAYPRVRQALRRARYAEHIAQMSRLAVQEPDPELLLHQVPAAAADALQVELVQVYLLEPDAQSFRLASGVGLLPEEPLGALLPNRPDTLIGFLAAQDGQPVTVHDHATEARFRPPQACLRHGLVSALGVPLFDKGRVMGVLLAGSRQPDRFGDDERRFLESLANLLTTLLLRAQSEEALRHAQRLESVGQLTGGIAHDFNNLLTVIQGNLQVLEALPEIEAAEHGQQPLASAMRATRRAAELTGKLLAFSRRQMLQPSPVHLPALLQSLSDMLARTLDQRIRIRVQVAPECPACLADPGQLESALLNIAINARDAMPQGGELIFSARPCERLPAPLHQELSESLGTPPRHENYVAVSISDTGTGMPEAVRKRAFEPFFTTKEAGRGTGLGLSTVYGFVKQSKGGVTIDSTPGDGTTVTLYLPRVPTAPQVPAAHGTATHITPGLKVLAVEDEPEVLRVVQAFLAGWGCEVTPARNAEQALGLLQTQGASFDLLLTDLVLGPGPSMPGTQLAARARQLHPGLAVVLMSGYASDLLASALQGEPQQPELLHKPFTRGELAAAIAKAMRR